MAHGRFPAAALVRSALYRDGRRGVEHRPAAQPGVDPRRGSGGRPLPGARSSGSSRLTALALLGLLDLLAGG